MSNSYIVVSDSSMTIALCTVGMDDIEMNTENISSKAEQLYMSLTIIIVNGIACEGVKSVITLLDEHSNI